MLELYDQEEIMRVQDKRNSVIMNVVIALREVGFSFSEVVNKLAKQFCLSKEIAENYRKQKRKAGRYAKKDTGL